SREQCIAGSLGDKLLDELPPVRSDGACHAHLRAALRRQHREDEHDQEDSRGHRKESEYEEETGEQGRNISSEFDVVTFHRLHTELMSLQRRREFGHHRTRQPFTVTDSARVRNGNPSQSSWLTS